ncbi:uncharacterized protein LOC114534862 [Dendronephthya gigantea]|uniref:uncharacterized protein LOC114534862 n=1 Tax=Dendronephthya gigantea TaxID=151771 RepID=UPI001069815E|nr:uncharacterized protein LOC114534862 [Dendronephthya gigantea]
MTISPRRWKTLSSILFIFEKSLNVILMFLLNFLPRFWTGGQSLQLRYWLYKAALMMYSLNNSMIALLGSIVAAYKVLSVESNVETRHPEVIAVVGLMFLVTNNGFRYFVADFFFSKIFADELDILGGNTIEKSIGAQNEDDNEQKRHRMTPFK